MRAETVGKRLLSYLKRELENNKLSYKAQPKLLEGGNESIMYTFQLENAPKDYSKKQVLRIYPKYAKNTRALREGIVQNYLHNQGFPTPSVPFICTDTEPLDAPFIIMNYIEGMTIDQYSKHDWDLGQDILIDIQIELQKIDPEPLRELYKSSGIPEKDYTWLCQYNDSSAKDADWINPALEWIINNKPEPKYSICHGDFHANNILVDNNGEVMGVLDWANVSIDDPLRDYASSYALISTLAPCMFPERAEELEYRSGKGLRYYSSKVGLDESRFAYWQAFKCLMVMIALEHGVEIYGRFGIIEAMVQLFTDLTSVEIHQKRG